MKYLKSFKEAVIAPNDFSDMLSILKASKAKTLKEVNNISQEYGVKFVTVDEFSDSLSSEKEK